MELPQPERNSLIRAAVAAEYACHPSASAEALAEQLYDFLDDGQIDADPVDVQGVEVVEDAPNLRRRLGDFALKELEAFRWFSKECVKVSPAGGVAGFLYKEIRNVLRGN